MGENGNKKDPLKCPKCGKEIKDNDEYHKVGRVKRGVWLGNGVDLGNNVVKEHYDSSFNKHPFYLEDDSNKDKNNRNGIEAHHLVSSASFKQDDKYKRLALYLGYNINHWKNGLLLPNTMHVACHFGVPLHKGGHGSTFIKKESERDIDSLAGMTDRISEFLGTVSEDGDVVFPVFDKANELTALKYESHLNALVASVCKQFLKKPKFCKSKIIEKEKIAEDFVNAIDNLSQSIFRELNSFNWTLTSDGFDYAPGRIGCCNKKYLYEKRQLIAQKVKNLPEVARNMMNAIYSSPDKQKEVTDNLVDKRCIAGTMRHSRKITNNNRAYFKERVNIPTFKLKDK